MTTFRTMNPIGSKSPKDLSDNAENLDYLMLGPLSEYEDRRGAPRLSWKGIELAFIAAQNDRTSEFESDQDLREETFERFIDGSGWSSLGAYAAGISIVSHTQTVDYLGQPYSLKPSIPASLDAPYVTTGIWATEGVNFKLVGDNSLRQDLADPSNTLVKHQRTSLAIAVDHSIAKTLSQLSVDLWDFSGLVTSRPVPEDFGSWDWTPAFEAARVVLGALGGGCLTLGPGGVYQALEIRLDRNIVIDGRGVNGTELKQIGGANRDFIKSENFDILSLSGLNVNDPRVPSWFGLRDIRVNGNRFHATNNPTGNTSGFPVKFYGPAQILDGTVLIYDGAGGGLYTEDSIKAAGSSWRAQEEGKFGNVIIRSCGGFAGWHCRGPHNNSAQSIISGFNDGWNFYSEEKDLYGGSFDYIGVLHSYAGGRSASPALDTGVYIGGIARIDTLVIDGDNAVLQANDLQIDKLRAYNIGGQMDGVVVNGANCYIGHLNAIVWSLSVGKTALTVNGENADISGTITTNNPDNEGAVFNALGGKGDLTIRNFSAAGRTGLKLNGTGCDIEADIRNCAVGFDYVAGTDNQVKLSILTTAGQVPVKGLAPRAADRINIRSRGNTIGGCKTNLQTPTVAMDITTYTIVTIAHGLLYTPPPGAVRLNWLVSSPDSSLWDEALLRVVTTTATEVVLGYKLASAAPAGTQARIGISIDLT